MATENVGNIITYPIVFMIVLVVVSVQFTFFWNLCLLATYFLVPFKLYVFYLLNFRKYRRENIRSIMMQQIDPLALAPIDVMQEIDPAPIDGQGPTHSASILFNLLWLTTGFGLPLCIFTGVIGLIQLATIVGIASGLETLRIAWYLFWPLGYYYYPITREHYLRAQSEKQFRVRELQLRYLDKNAENV
eukprot:Phypoly_transcript_20703.p1 GENE.Phypoly_transcript_20703~~Phypoly_transcript_20703.p1  ORF type:complete len:211 (+),score=8.41 Phypoly_transcript_20703:69-635(+)